MGAARGVAKTPSRPESSPRPEASAAPVMRPVVAPPPPREARVAEPVMAPMVREAKVNEPKVREPKVREAQVREPRTREPKAATDWSGVWTGLQKTFTMTTGGALLAAAGVLGLTIIIWSLAWRRGYSFADAKAVRELGSPTVQDPLKKAPIRVNPDLLGRDQPGRTSTPNEAAKPQPRQPTAPPPTTTPPAPGSDPRQAGLNYLTLASQLDKETATTAAAFLTENGCPAFAVAVDRSGRPVKNGSQFAVYAQRGFASEEFRAKESERQALVEQVRRLGKAWQKDHRGGTDFSQTFWQKYAP